MTKPVPAQPRTGSQAVERAIAVLYAFGSDNPSLSISELAARVGLPVSTTHRIASALVRGRLLARDRTDRYRIGEGLTALAGSTVQRIDVENIAPHLHLLSSKISITASVGICDGDIAVTAYSARPPTKFCAHQLPETRERAYASAMGRAQMAFDAPTERSPARQAAFAAIRGRGYAVTRTGVDREVTAIAVPVFDAVGRVQAALGVQAKSVRLDLGLIARVVPEMRSTAAALGRTL